MGKFRQIRFQLCNIPGVGHPERKFTIIGSLLAAMLSGSTVLWAGDADVVDVSVTPAGENRYSIDVSVSHADTGWDHYANGWDVLDDKGKVLGTRELLHPHVNEQPFTRSLTVTLDPGVKSITLRANDSVHGNKGKTITVDLPG